MLSNTVQGCALLEQKHSPCSCAYVRQASHHHREYCKKFDHKTFVRMLPSQDLKIMKFTCMASSNSHRKNPDFSRQNKGFSRGRNRQNQDREKAERSEDSEILSSKNGPMLSISANSRHQATTATPGKREKEIVELFRKVQAQLRERAAVKEEKKIESFQQGQGEKGTVDSLLKLLRKHSVEQGKRSGSGENDIPDRPERSISFDEEKTSSFIEADNIAIDEDVQEPQPVPYTRPASKFQRRSPVPRVKFQPVYSEQEDVGKDSPTAAGDKELGSVGTDLESVFFDEREEPFEEDLSDSSDVEEPEEDIEEPSVVENRDLGSMKLLELKELAKSRGVKGYSKLKKVELVKLLVGM